MVEILQYVAENIQSNMVLSIYFQPSILYLWWQNCTSLQGLFLYARMCGDIATKPNLVHFAATIESGESAVVLPPATTLQHLETLILLSGETMPDDSQIRLLDVMTIPSL